jgi:DNA helicase-4
MSLQNEKDLASKSLLVLARYNHLFDDHQLQKSLKQIWPGKLLKPRTIHRSKGLEADYVIVMGLTSDRYGFPSEISDDPLLEMVLAEPDNYPHAEERRLFYVALTRAKKQVHLIVDRQHPSVFALELINEKYDVRIVGENKEDEICPECKSGIIEEKKPNFYSCSNYPFCEYIAPLCIECSEEHMSSSKQSVPKKFDCIDTECQGTAPVCPKCGVGAVIPKSGKYGDFLSCHIWPRCDYARNTTHHQIPQ